ncbi:hypothetical protein MBANPS3_010931 [Mucor bainieri]
MSTNNNIANFTVPADAYGIEHYFKTIPLSQWSFWDYGSHHPHKLFSILKKKYLENLNHIEKSNNSSVIRHIKRLKSDLKMCRAAEWKQSLNGTFLVQPAPPPPSLALASPSPSSPSPPLPPCHQEYGIPDTVWQQALAESKDKYSTLPAV